MKKTLLLSFLLFQLTFVFGQTNPQWGSWTPVSCYTRLSTSVLGNGYVKSIKEYSWQVRIKSSYSKKVTFNMTWIVGGERLSIGQVTLSPGESYGHTPRYFKSSSNNIYVEVSEVCFEGQDCYKYGYADCNGNQAKITSGSTTASSTYNPSTTQTNNRTAPQQNDLTEYNRSKADLERQMAEKNAEIQRQNQENQRKQQLLKQQQQQQYNNSVNQANSVLQSGNYTGAMQSYADAAKTATTKSEKNLAVTGAVVSGIGGVFDAIAKAKEEKRERERAEQQQREQRRLEQEREAERATNLMEQNWQSALNLSKQGEYNQAIKLMLPYLNADKINADATSLIGFWFYNIADYKSAKICYEKALKIDTKSCAMHNLGTLYEEGLGVEKNKETALSYYKKACENEDETGCKNYEKLKPIVEEERKMAEGRKSDAKITIANFDFKPHVDYLVSQLEAQGFMFDNVSYFCTQELSKTLTIGFLKNNQKLVTTLQVEYSDALHQKLLYSVDDRLREDFSKLQLKALIGAESISSTLSNGSFMIKQAPKPISSGLFKNSKYKGFQQEIAISKQETLEAYLHNYGISCTDNNEKIKWLQKIVDAGGDVNYYLTLEDLYKVSGDAKNALKTFTSYVSKISDARQLSNLSENVKASLKNNLETYSFNKLIAIAETGNANASYELANIYRSGEISGESKRTSANSVTVPIIRVEKNWEKAVKYYTNAYEGSFQKGYAACSIANLYEDGGNHLEKNTTLYKEWKKKAKEAGYKCK